MPVVALLTDFGLKDNYIGVMKGVMLKINPQLHFVDISHEIPFCGVKEAAFFLLNSYSYFPKKTIFLTVVDPQVGSKQRRLAVKTKNYYFVGPDNGVLHPAAYQDGVVKIVSLDNSRYFLKKVSNTFHGRDIFAPVAAYLSRNLSVVSLGSQIKRMNRLIFIKAKVEQGILRGEVFGVDKFGNIITNILRKDFINFTGKNNFISYLNGKKITRFYDFYSQAPDSKPFFIEGSSSFIELSIRERSAYRYFKPKNNQIITVKISGQKLPGF